MDERLVIRIASVPANAIGAYSILCDNDDQLDISEQFLDQSIHIQSTYIVSELKAVLVAIQRARARGYKKITIKTNQQSTFDMFKNQNNDKSHMDLNEFKRIIGSKIQEEMQHIDVMFDLMDAFEIVEPMRLAADRLPKP